MDVKTE